MRVRVLFMGSPAFAVPSLDALIKHEAVQIVGAVTQPDKPAGRGQKLSPPAVKVAAEHHGLPVLQPSKIKTADTLAAFVALRPDLIVVVAYGRILPTSVLALPELGCVNVHASLLPRHRGASPVAQAILEGDAKTGVSIMQLDEGLDTGPVYAQRVEAIAPTDTTEFLSQRLSYLGADLLCRTLPDILAAHAPTAQKSDGATYAPLLTKDAAVLDFTRDAVALERQVRAMVPWPVAYAMLADRRVQVLAAHVADGEGDAGRVLAAGPMGVVVGCKAGTLVLDQVKPAGKGAMSAASWAAGRGVVVGDVLRASP